MYAGHCLFLLGFGEDSCCEGQGERSRVLFRRFFAVNQGCVLIIESENILCLLFFRHDLSRSLLDYHMHYNLKDYLLDYIPLVLHRWG